MPGSSPISYRRPISECSDEERPSLAQRVREMEERHDGLERLAAEVIATFSLARNREQLSALGDVGKTLLEVADRWKKRFNIITEIGWPVQVLPEDDPPK